MLSESLRCKFALEESHCVSRAMKLIVESVIDPGNQDLALSESLQRNESVFDKSPDFRGRFFTCIDLFESENRSLISCFQRVTR